MQVVYNFVELILNTYRQARTNISDLLTLFTLKTQEEEISIKIQFCLLKEFISLMRRKKLLFPEITIPHNYEEP